MARASSRALLIGCDFYSPGDEDTEESPLRFPHLGGAVRDVDDVESFLVNLGVPKDKIVKLTASYKPHSPLHPAEDDTSKWPTHANIIRELESITEQSNHGTLVYIHFSGHGIQRRKLSKDKMSSGGDSLYGAALVTTNALTRHGRYLTANELGLRVQAMVRKGLRATLVLDACFSGGGLRNDTTYTLRSIPEFQDDSDLKSDKIAENEASEYFSRISGLRQAEVKEDWLSKPVGCTVLTACGMQQTAGEYAFQETNKGTIVRRGVLTHWMLEFLNQRRTPNLPSHKSVKEYVEKGIAKMSQHIHQVPVLYGDAEHEFFGAKKYVSRPTCQVIEMWDDKVRLNVGSAQCVAVGAVYDVYPSDVDCEDIRNFRLAHEARIVKVDSFHSVATLADRVMDNKLDCVTEGSSGVLRTWALREEVFVRFLPEEANLRIALESELAQTPNLALVGESSDRETFIVKINENNAFDILERDLNGTNFVRLERLPVVAVDTELAIPKLAHVLRHISRYRDIERLWEHPRSTRVQEGKLDIVLSRGAERLIPIEVCGVRRFDVIEGELLGLRLKYSGPAPFVWVTIFELNPSWGITKRYASKLVKDITEPGEYSRPIEVRTTIPPKSTLSDSDDACDNFMALVTEGEDEQSWDEIMLNDLPISAELLQMSTAVDTSLTTKTRAHFSLPRALPDRHWGVVSFVIHSSPRASIDN